MAKVFGGGPGRSREGWRWRVRGELVGGVAMEALAAAEGATLTNLRQEFWDGGSILLEVWLVQFLLKQAGVDKRTGDLYGNRDLLNIARNMARGLKGVENVYTQHQPLIFQTMEGIVKGRLRDADYPLVGNHFQQGRPQDVVIFIVGGTTYEEARSVALYNAANPGVRFFLGGSVVLNSKRFLENLGEAQRISKSSTLL
uniref:Vacuolar sorting-associated protein 45-like protein n=1 Tax=Aegilops tauschii TaxID=37682 RepID=M8BED2_AEGTA